MYFPFGGAIMKGWGNRTNLFGKHPHVGFNHLLANIVSKIECLSVTYNLGQAISIYMQPIKFSLELSLIADTEG